MKIIWKIINAATLLSILFVIVYSEYIAFQINTYRDYLNSVENNSLNDFEHMIRLIVNKWEGIALSFTLSFIFLIRFLTKRIVGTINKISKN